MQSGTALGGGGTKAALSGPGAADPVLGAAELAGGLAAAAPTRQQHAVDLPEQPVGQREAFREAAEPMLERRHVVRDFAHVVERDPGRLLQLEQEEVRQRRLGSFDPGGEHRLLAYVGVQDQRFVRQERRDGVQPSEGERCRFERLLQRAVRQQGRIRRQGRRYEGANRLPSGDRHLVPADLSPLHVRTALFKYCQ